VVFPAHAGKGLAFRKQSKVNWCPLCATVLANEQVIDGCCWRHEDTVVEQRDLEQWFLRTTNYAQELLDGLDHLPGWPEKVRTMQRNWIGRSEGATVEFVLDPAAEERRKPAGANFPWRPRRILLPVPRSIRTRSGFPSTPRVVDTIFGATSLQLAPQHPLVKQFAQADERLAAEVATLVEEQKKAREAGDPAAIDKHGSFTGHYAINPFNGERLPIWVANYILLEYGTGAVMSVPAHDERDYEFAKKYGLEVRIVVLPRRTASHPPPVARTSRCCLTPKKTAC
jgi:leucyl-tRNA synthetase